MKKELFNQLSLSKEITKLTNNELIKIKGGFEEPIDDEEWGWELDANGNLTPRRPRIPRR